MNLRASRARVAEPCLATFVTEYCRVMAMILHLSEDDEKVLAALAEADGISQHQAIIRAIHEVAARREHVQADATGSARARSRYAELLKRLGH